MWRNSSSSGGVKPKALDTESSKVVVYVRKDFVEVPSCDIDGKESGTHWEFLENAIPKEDWETYSQVAEHTESIASIEDALCELSKEG